MFSAHNKAVDNGYFSEIIWSSILAITSPVVIVHKITTTPVKSAIKTEETDQSIIVKCDGINYYFDKATGYIQKVAKPTGTISLSGGPVQAGVEPDSGYLLICSINRECTSLHYCIY
jgi:hypothetical protein